MLTRVKSRRLFIATDLSPLGNLAIPLALAQAGKGARILLFHAVEPVFALAPSFGPEAPVAVYDPAMTLRRVAHERRSVEGLVSGIPGAKALTLGSGQVHRAIVREAKRFHTDLLVMSTHGRSGMSKLLFGSVAQKVLAHYRGEVLLLRPKGAKG